MMRGDESVERSNQIMSSKRNGILPLIVFSILAMILAYSPIILLESNGAQIGITSEDLSEDQIATLKELNLSRNEADTRSGLTTISAVILESPSGDLLLAGTWESGSSGFEDESNHGGRDGFIARLSRTGHFEILGTFGSSGQDSVIDFFLDGDELVIRGYLHGEGFFGQLNIEDSGVETVYQAHLNSSGWSGVWEIEEVLIEGVNGNVWCGF